MKALLVLLLCSFQVKAQQNHFIYIESPNILPFYIRINQQVYSSTADGYLILAPLPSGNYPCVIGFPKNQWPTQSITVSLANQDLGFLLQQDSKQRWGLINLIDTTRIAATAKSVPGLSSNVTLDEFSTVLAAASNTILIKDASGLPGLSGNDTNKLTENREDTKTVHPTASVLSVALLSSSLDSNIRHSTYLVKEANSTDTISVELLYVPKDSIPTTPLVSSRSDSVQVSLLQPASCAQSATQTDLDSLMSVLVNVPDSINKINLAVQHIQEKCFSVEQIRVLTDFFSAEADKCVFLLAAYPYTPNPIEFKTLQSVLQDEKNIKQFSERVR